MEKETHGTKYADRSQQEINRLLMAAIINQRFRKLLLTNPKSALEEGFQGEVFRLNPDERERLFSIRADSLSDLATQLGSNLPGESIDQAETTEP